MNTITTFVGDEVNPLCVNPENVHIEDLAHALALCNRFAGHSRFPISVAQHSVLVSLLCDSNRDNALAGLLHDGSEAYLGDVTKWLKESPEMALYRTAELRAQDSVYVAFGLQPRPRDAVEWADRLAVRYEFELAFGRGQRVEGYGEPSHGERATLRRVCTEYPHLWRPCMTWPEAEAAFLHRFRDLTR
jgi:hypothetical protein